MGVYIARLKDHQQVAKGTMAYSFERPDGFDFVGGQSIDLTLIDPPETDAEGNTRAFSLASAPHEPFLMVATRQRDTAFKRVLKTMPLGAEAKIEGPFGSMTLHRNITRPAVILAGDIGITPFRGIICQAIKANTGHSIILFYSNRLPEDAAFLTELKELARQHTNFTLIATMTNIGNSGISWDGEKGYINAEMLTRFVGHLAEPVYYTAGPPAMVAAMKDILSAVGVDEEDINSENFSGY